MCKRWAAVALLAALLVGGAGAARADVLMSNEKPLDLYGNATKAQPGDVITVLIQEGISVNGGVSATDKNTDSATATKGGGGLSFLPALAAGAQRDRKTDTTSTQTQTMQTNMTVRIVGIEPNGNLILDGTREVMNGKQKVTFKLHAVARPQDVQPDNTVQSSRLVDLAFKVDGLPKQKGAGGDIFRTIFGIFLP